MEIANKYVFHSSFVSVIIEYSNTCAKIRNNSRNIVLK